MKKLLVSALISVMAIAMVGCGAKEEAVEETTEVVEEAAEEEVAEEATEEVEVEAEETEARTTFTVGFDAEFPPYGYMDDDGEYVGFDLDLAAEVASRNGWEFVKQPIDWDSKDMELSSGTIDCIWNGFTMNGREDDYTWSVPYVDNSQVFVVKEDAGITSKADLAGKVVGVQAGSSALAALEDEESQENLDLAASFSDLIEYADYNTGFMDLDTGAIDAIAMDIGVANYQITSRDGGFVVLEEQLATEQYGIGFLKGNEELKDQVEATLYEMIDDGTFDTITEKYADFGLVDSVCIGK